MKCYLIVYFIAAIIFIYGCKKDCIANSSALCDPASLLICDSASIDLERYEIRADTLSQFGVANAVKSVPKIGEIAWQANNSIYRSQDSIYYLSLANYADTSWYGLEYWAYLREVIVVKFDPNILIKQNVVSEFTYNNNEELSYGYYRRNLDDYFDAKWKINEGKDNYIWIIKFDKDQKIVEGEFSLNFTIEEQSELPGIEYSERISFRCGHFRAKIYN